MPLDTKISVRVKATHTRALDLGTATLPLEKLVEIALATGTGTSQADYMFTDTRTIAASSNEDLDLAAALSDAFGTTLTFVKVKAILIKAADGNTNNVRVTRPASNGVPLFLAASDGLDVTPGGVFLFIAPGAGVTVTAATGDLINVANSSSGSSVTYDVIIIGTSA